MIKEIDIKEDNLTRLEIFAFIGGTSIEELVNEVITNYLSKKEQELFDIFNEEQKESYAFYLLMNQSKRTSHINSNDVKELLKSIQE